VCKSKDIIWRVSGSLTLLGSASVAVNVCVLRSAKKKRKKKPLAKLIKAAPRA